MEAFLVTAQLSQQFCFVKPIVRCNIYPTKQQLHELRPNFWQMEKWILFIKFCRDIKWF